VSKARISIAANRDKAAPFFAVLERHLDARSGNDSGPRLGPFHEDDRIVEIGLEVPPLRGRNAPKAEEVEMRDVDAAGVAVTDRVGRARDRNLDAERAAGTADEGRLSRTELAGDGDDVARPEARRKTCGDLLGLCGGVRLDQNRPSCTAGSATTGAT
jgi:hypothetical protein